MVDVAQLVRASDCGSEGRGFEPHLPPDNSQARVRACLGVLFLQNCLSPLIKFVFYYKHFKILHSIISEGYSVISCNVVAKSL